MDVPPLKYYPATNPWLLAKEEELFAHIGGVIVSFSKTEFLMSRLCVELSRLEPYDFRTAYPIDFKKKVGYIRKCLERPGPLSIYRTIGETFLKRIEQVYEDRTFMAHATLISGFSGGPDGFLVRLGRLKHTTGKASELSVETRHWQQRKQLQSILTSARKAALFAQSAHRFLLRRKLIEPAMGEAPM